MAGYRRCVPYFLRAGTVLGALCYVKDRAYVGDSAFKPTNLWQKNSFSGAHPPRERVREKVGRSLKSNSLYYLLSGEVCQLKRTKELENKMPDICWRVGLSKATLPIYYLP